MTAGCTGGGPGGPPLRVLHVSPASFGADGVFGGGERYPYELARAMSSLCSVTFLTFGRQARRYQDGTLDVRVLHSRGHWKGAEVNPLSEGLLTEIGRADVVHVHQWESVVANVCVLVGRMLGKKTFATDLGGSGINYWRRLRLQRLLTGFIPVSEFGAGLYPELEDKTQVVLGGVDGLRFSPDLRVDRARRAVFVGRLLPHKGIDRVIDAIPSTLELLVIGRPYDREYRDYLSRRARGKCVEFRESVEDDELVEAYQGSRVAILPSVYQPSYGPPSNNPELLGLTLLEAMACGTPVVCTAVGGMPEIVGQSEAGFVISPDDPPAMAAALTRLIENDELWATMSTAALARAQDLSWSAIARRCLAIYLGSDHTLEQTPARPI
jgi:glycosyltransferase involved in cell wall biosynthesis